MRIGIFSDTYIPFINGVSTSIDALRKELERKGHEVFIVTVAPKGMKYVYDKNVIRIPGIPIGIFDYRLTSIYPAKAIKTIKSWNLDVIHSQTEFGIGSFARIIAKQFNIPIIHTYHTYYEDCIDYITKGHFEKSSVKVVQYLTKFYCDKTISELIVPTKKAYDLFKDKYKVKRDIYIIPTGIEIEKFHPKRFKEKQVANLRKEIGLNEDDLVLLYIGRLGYEKNISFLIKNHAQIVKNNPNCKLVIVGDGPERPKLEKLVSKLKLDEFVIFTGKIAQDNIPLYYQIGTIFVTASCSETQGLTVIEALSAGLPCVTVDDDSFKNAIENGSNGYLFSNKKQYIDNILELITNDKKRQYMASEALKSSERHSSRVFADRVLKVYELAIGETPRPKGWYQKLRYIIKGGK